LVLGLYLLPCGVGQAALPAPNLTFLDNGQVRIGMDLSLGGAVTGDGHRKRVLPHFA
jgi:hypothetical protein